MSNETPLRKFRKEIGKSPEEIGKFLGVGRATIYRWEKGTYRIPTKYLGKVEKITGISRQELRPDLFKGLS